MLTLFFNERPAPFSARRFEMRAASLASVDSLARGDLASHGAAGAANHSRRNPEGDGLSHGQRGQRQPHRWILPTCPRQLSGIGRNGDGATAVTLMQHGAQMVKIEGGG